jgi:excisionase family DNA binding protein
MSGNTDLSVAEFASRANVTRRTVERKIRTGEIAAGHVRRDGRRVFLHQDALTAFATLRHDAMRHAIRHGAPGVANETASVRPEKPTNTTRHGIRHGERVASRVANAEAARIADLQEALRRERERADKAEAHAEAADRERRELQGLLNDATKAVVLLQKQLAAPPAAGHVVDVTGEPARTDGKAARRRWWRVFRR